MLAGMSCKAVVGNDDKGFCALCNRFRTGDPQGNTTTSCPKVFLSPCGGLPSSQIANYLLVLKPTFCVSRSILISSSFKNMLLKSGIFLVLMYKQNLLFGLPGPRS